MLSKILQITKERNAHWSLVLTEPPGLRPLALLKQDYNKGVLPHFFLQNTSDDSFWRKVKHDLSLKARGQFRIAGPKQGTLS